MQGLDGVGGQVEVEGLAGQEQLNLTLGAFVCDDDYVAAIGIVEASVRNCRA